MRSWVFTHNNPTGDLPVWDKIRYVSWQLEKGESGTPHWQGYVELSAPQRLAAMKKWLPGAHFEQRKGTREEARAYTRKEDTRVDGPWERGSWEAGGSGRRGDLAAARDLILAGATRREILEEIPEVLAKYPRFVDTCLKVAAEEKVTRVLELEPRAWQAKVLEMVNTEPDDRQILWIFDPVGNTGKTHLARHLVDKFGAFYTNGGKSVDITHAYSGERIVVFDYVRDHQEYVGYGVIEQLKNGILFSPKYDSGMKRFDAPHVLIFANFLPDSSKFSQDRLVLVKVEADGNYQLMD